MAKATCERDDAYDDLAVMGVDGEYDAHDLAIPAGDLQTIGRPALVGRRRDHASHGRRGEPRTLLRYGGESV
jgi:hypothetical protein